MNAYLEGRLGSLICGGGLIWAAYIATQQVDFNIQEVSVAVPIFRKILFSTGPLEVCSAGILIWLHSKYRLTTSLKR